MSSFDRGFNMIDRKWKASWYLIIIILQRKSISVRMLSKAVTEYSRGVVMSAVSLNFCLFLPSLLQSADLVHVFRTVVSQAPQSHLFSTEFSTK